jgi:hypothetical protein
MTSQAAAAVSVLAADPVNNFGDTRGGALAGPLGLFLILVLLVATVLLIRNMNSRLRKLPREFPPPSRDHGHTHDAASAAPVSPAPGGPPASGATQDPESR